MNMEHTLEKKFYDQRSFWLIISTVFFAVITAVITIVLVVFVTSDNNITYQSQPVAAVVQQLTDLEWDTSIDKGTLTIEWNNTYLDIYGVPLFLNGSFYRNGPVLWRYGDSRQKSNPHWFSGLGMLHSFKFNPNTDPQLFTISYSCRFINSTDYNLNNPHSTYTPTLDSFNTLDTIHRLDKDTLLAGTDQLIPNSFATDNVVTKQAPFPFNDTVWNGSVEYSPLAPAHMQYDAETQELFSFYYGINGSRYFFYHIKPNTQTRIVAANALYPLNKLGKTLYHHSFGLTKQYMILCEQPMIFDFVLNKAPEWIANTNTIWYIVDRYNGVLIKYFESKPFAWYHWVNSFETDNGLIVVDIINCGTNGTALYNSMYINTIINNYPDFIKHYANSHAVRFIFDLNSTVDKNGGFVIGESVTHHKGCEYPILNREKYNMKEYQYMYCLSLKNEESSKFIDAIMKVNVDSLDLNNNYQLWYKDNQYPSEPLFVNKHQQNTEDDGILISVVFNGDNNSTYLLILNAVDLTEIATAQVDLISHIPVGFHGKYYDES